MFVKSSHSDTKDGFLYACMVTMYENNHKILAIRLCDIQLYMRD